MADEHEHQDLLARQCVDVTWLHRDGAPAGTTSLLVDTVRALARPGGRPHVWGAAESHAMTAIRRHGREERGLDRAAVSLVAY